MSSLKRLAAGSIFGCPMEEILSQFRFDEQAYTIAHSRPDCDVIERIYRLAIKRKGRGQVDFFLQEMCPPGSPAAKAYRSLFYIIRNQQEELEKRR